MLFINHVLKFKHQPGRLNVKIKWVKALPQLLWQQMFLSSDSEANVRAEGILMTGILPISNGKMQVTVYISS
jgi:hypothetical protein